MRNCHKALQALHVNSASCMCMWRLRIMLFWYVWGFNVQCFDKRLKGFARSPLKGISKMFKGHASYALAYPMPAICSGYYLYLTCQLCSGYIHNMPAMLWLIPCQLCSGYIHPMPATLWLIPCQLCSGYYLYLTCQLCCHLKMLPFKGVVSIHHSKQPKALRLSGALGLALRGIALKVLKRPLRA